MSLKETIYVDVDDTLVRTAGTKRIPIKPVIDAVQSYAASGAVMVCWSSGGAEYARASAQELGIEDCFEIFLTKPTMYIDDQPVSDWLTCEHRYPTQV